MPDTIGATFLQGGFFHEKNKHRRQTFKDYRDSPYHRLLNFADIAIDRLCVDKRRFGSAAHASRCYCSRRPGELYSAVILGRFVGASAP
jgi:hypothetical protein